MPEPQRMHYHETSRSRITRADRRLSGTYSQAACLKQSQPLFSIDQMLSSVRSLKAESGNDCNKASDTASDRSRTRFFSEYGARSIISVCLQQYGRMSGWIYLSAPILWQILRV